MTRHGELQWLLDVYCELKKRAGHLHHIPTLEKEIDRLKYLIRTEEANCDRD